MVSGLVCELRASVKQKIKMMTAAIEKRAEKIFTSNPDVEVRATAER
jgi:hypothetical protein